MLYMEADHGCLNYGRVLQNTDYTLLIIQTQMKFSDFLSCSPDGAKQNPGQRATSITAPDSPSFHPGYLLIGSFMPVVKKIACGAISITFDEIS